MPNSSYLCTADRDSLYPSTTVADFAPDTGVVAYDARCVPLLWLTLAAMESVQDLEAERADLIEIAQLRAGRPFPAARMLLGDHEPADDDYWNLSRLLGTGFGAAVPWEPNA